MTIFENIPLFNAEAPDEVKDFCLKCGQEIVYDKEDGYWDSFVKEEDGKRYWTLACDEEMKEYHEPVNFVRNSQTGIYHRK
jgi:hypothetical protein